jgi:hypothetical protein
MERNKLRINATTLGELMNALETMREQRIKELKKNPWFAEHNYTEEDYLKKADGTPLSMTYDGRYESYAVVTADQIDVYDRTGNWATPTIRIFVDELY